MVAKALGMPIEARTSAGARSMRTSWGTWTNGRNGRRRIAAARGSSSWDDSRLGVYTIHIAWEQG